MIARVFHDPPTDNFEILLGVDTGRGLLPIRIEDGHLTYGELLDYNEPMPTTLTLNSRDYESFRRALIGEAIDSDDALRDTRQVRDRLLGMVERVIARGS